MESVVVAKRLKCSFVSGIFLLLQLCSVHSLTLEQLRAEPKLTPAKFIQFFADFKFQLREDVQKPDAFLASKTGDCDDFASLAASLLREKGYTTRLVAVYMDHEVHVVCHVAETHCYLDYNYRSSGKLIPTDGTLDDIALKVSSDFRSSWHSVSEFTYSQNRRQFVSTQFH